MRLSPLFLMISLALIGCTQMRRRAELRQTQATQSSMDSVEMEWAALEKTEDAAEDGHALVEANEGDEQIAAVVGGNLDQDQPDLGLETPAVTVQDRPFLKQVHTKRVKFWIDYFAVKQRDRFQRFLNNGEMYRPIIEKILDEQNLPRGLFYVGLIESGYYLGAHSHARALGPWQFMPGTGKRYGLTVNRELDERRDVFKSTMAAAQYFKDLHNIFSSWELALASYNAGEYGMIRRITRHKSRDYYDLSRRGLMPKETVNYVPKVLAAMYVAEHAEKYGFVLPKGSARFWQKTKMVRAPKGVSLARLSDRLGVTQTLLVKLNPELRHSRTPRHYRGSYELRVPADKHTEWMDTLVADEPATSPRIKEIEDLKERLENPSAVVALERVPASKPRYHRVRRGETLIGIAHRHHMGVSQLAHLNGLSTKWKVRIGRRLRLSGEEKLARSIAKTKTKKKTKAKSSSKVLTYRVQPGDTLSVLSVWFNVSSKSIKKINKLTSSRLVAGRKIKIPHTRKGIYTVRRGDALIQLGERFGIHHKAIMRLNNLKKTSLWAGQRLVVSVGSDS